MHHCSIGVLRESTVLVALALSYASNPYSPTDSRAATLTPSTLCMWRCIWHYDIVLQYSDIFLEVDMVIVYRSTLSQVLKRISGQWLQWWCVHFLAWKILEHKAFDICIYCMYTRERISATCMQYTLKSTRKIVSEDLKTILVWIWRSWFPTSRDLTTANHTCISNLQAGEPSWMPLIFQKAARSSCQAFMESKCWVHRSCWRWSSCVYRVNVPDITSRIHVMPMCSKLYFRDTQYTRVLS